MDYRLFDDSGCHGRCHGSGPGAGAVFRTRRHAFTRIEFDLHGRFVEKEGGEEVTGKMDRRLKRPLGVTLQAAFLCRFFVSSENFFHICSPWVFANILNSLNTVFGLLFALTERDVA